MSKITISGETTKSKDEIENHLLNLVRSRLSALKDEIQSIKGELNEMEQKYDMDSDRFYQKFQSGKLGDNREFFVWDGLINVLEDLESEQETLRELF